jgi:hypothetical protein
MHETRSVGDARGRTRSFAVRGAGRIPLLTILIVGLAVAASAFAAAARAETIGPITFEPAQGYALGDINGQQSWMKLGPYDTKVAGLAAFPAASAYGFGTQALRLSDATTSGSFGDQTFSPAFATPAGEFPGRPHFEASFNIGTTQATLQPGLHMSVSPDDGNGARVSYLRFEDQAAGVHVFFDDVTDSGPLGTVASFNETDIATLGRGQVHSIEFLINFNNGPGNDVVKVYIDGKNRIKGTTWENYYRYDPEQAGSGNQVPAIHKLLFRVSGAPGPGNAGKGFLVDGLTLESSGHH